MAQKRVILPDIGEVILAKRRGSTNMRLSINAKGQVRVGLPYWTPYAAGLLFLKSKDAWLKQHLADNSQALLHSGDRIGKAHRMIFFALPARNGIADAKVTATTIEVSTILDMVDSRVQAKAREASEKALKLEASQLLPARVRNTASKNRLVYSELKIRKLTSRWGSCSTKKNISLSYFLMQLPWELIDYVILHELAHTKYLNHSSDFWSFMESNLPNVRQLRKQLRQYKPRIAPA